MPSSQSVVSMFEPLNTSPKKNPLARCDQDAGLKAHLLGHIVPLECLASSLQGRSASFLSMLGALKHGSDEEAQRNKEHPRHQGTFCFSLPGHPCTGAARAARGSRVCLKKFYTRSLEVKEFKLVLA